MNLNPQGSSGGGGSIRKSPQIDVFTELDPLGTGLSKPYIDKKDFFQHLKNPPKKVLKDLVTTNSGETFPTNFDISLDSLDPIKVGNGGDHKSGEIFEDGDFANFDKFDSRHEFSGEAMEASGTSVTSGATSLPSKIEPSKQVSNRSNQRLIHHQPLSVSLPPEDSPIHEKSFNFNNTTPASSSSTPRMDKESSDPVQSLMRIPSPKKYRTLRKKEFDTDLSSVSRLRKSVDKPFPVDFSGTNDAPGSPLRSCSSEANSRLSSSSAELDIVPEPPPRGAGSILINPPPLPPKKQGARGGNKPPPRPPHTDTHLHYDFIEREETSPSPTKRERPVSPARTEDNKHRFDDNFSPPSPHTLRQSEGGTGSSGISSSRFETMTPTTLSTLFRNPYMSNVSGESKKVATTTNSTVTTRPSLDITLSQLTSSNLAEFATSLNMSVSELTSLTLQQLTECLAKLSAREVNDSANSRPNINSPVSRSTPTGLPDIPPTSAKTPETSFVATKPLFKADFDQAVKFQPQPSEEQPSYDKYAVFRELLEMEQKKDDANNGEVNDSMESIAQQESHDRQTDPGPVLMPELTDEPKDELVRMTNLLSTCDLSVDLPPHVDRSLQKEINKNLSGNGEKDDDIHFSKENIRPVLDEINKDDNNKIDGDNEEENTKPFETQYQEMLPSIKCVKVKLVREDTDVTEDQGRREQEIDEEEEDEDEEDEEDEEEEDEAASAGAAKTSSSVQIATLVTDTKDRYAALREIVDDVEPESATAEGKLPSPSVASPVQQQTLLNLLKIFSEPEADSPSPRKPATQNEEELKAVSADIFEEIRMLNSSSDQCVVTCGLNKNTVGPSTATGFEDVFCPFPESKPEPNKDGRESAGSVKDESNWAKFESSVAFHSDKSSYEGQGSVGGTSPWSPDEKDFQMESVAGGVKLTPKQNYQQRLHSGESDNEWKDEEESEESNGKRQFRDDSGFWCGRHPRYEMPEEGSPYYEERGDRSDKERHFRERERSSRQPRGAPWPKQGTGHRTRDSSPWHEESPGRGWTREEDEPHHKLQRNRYHVNRKQMATSYKEEIEDPSKGYWKCRPKQRVWNGDRESFRNAPQPQPPPAGLQPSPHFGPEPMFYEEDRTKRRMMLWSEDDRDRDRFSSQESMAYEDEERWPRREYDRRRERWDDDGSGTGRFWPRRISSEADSRVDPRLDSRGEYGPPVDMYRKQHYCRGDSRELRDRPAGHELYVPASVGPTGCWPEDEYSVPLSDRPENSPRYLTRKRHWPKRPNSANDERNLSEPVYADPRFKYSMSRSECSDNDSNLYHRPYRSRSRESYWGSDQEFESWPGGGSTSERLYWSEGPDAKSESLHRRRMNRHKANRPASQKSQNSPFEDDFTEPIEANEPCFDSPVAEPSHVVIPEMEGKQPTTPRNVKEHLRNEQRLSRYAKPPGSISGSRGSGYFDETITSEPPSDRVRNSAELKSTPEDFPLDVEKVLGSGEDLGPEDNESRDSFYNGDPSPRFEDDAFAFKSEMADSVPETTTAPATSSLKNSRQIKYGNNKIKSEHDIKKSESVNIFVRESDPFDDDDFFK